MTKVRRVGDILRLERRAVEIEPLSEYTLIGVYSFGKGIFHREPRPGAQLGNYRFFEVKAGDLILSNIQAWEGAIAHAADEDEGRIGTHRFLTYVPVDPSGADTNYLRYYFLSEPGFALIQRASPGSVTRNRTLSIERFEALEIPLPPIEEQRRIAAHLDEVLGDAGAVRASCRGALDRLSGLEGAIAEAAFRKGPGWSEASVGDICEHPKYGYTASAEWEPIGPHLFRITDMTDGEVNWTQVPFCSPPKPDDYLLRDGDILVARTGSAGASMLVKDFPLSVFASYLIRLRVWNSVSAEYLYWYLQTPSYWEQIRGEVRGTAHSNVNSKRLQTIRVPVAPRDEQEQIVADLVKRRRSIRQLAGLQRKRVELATALEPAALAEAFNGAQVPARPSPNRSG